MAQGIVIEGSVRFKESEEPAAGVNVMLIGQDGKAMLGLALTDSNGNFRLEYSSSVDDSLIVRCTGIDIKMLEERIAPTSQRLDLIVSSSPIAIREARVKAAPMNMKGDTIVYYVGQYEEETDRSIGDVLKRMPGITVEENGRISYNGKPINRFYIEGMDMLGNSYGVATNNVRSEDIASVEVYERHQPVKALEDIERTDQAALNLRLKDKAKGVWNLRLQAGAGYKPKMWNAEALGMRFSKSFQTLLTYKGNNEGEDVASKEVLPFEQLDELNGILEIRSVPDLPIDVSRYLYNNLHAVSVNAMSKPTKDLDVIAKATYLKDRQTADGASGTRYYFSDGTQSEISEDLHARHSTNQANVELKLRNNSSRHYLNESVEFNGFWDDGYGTAGETYQWYDSHKIVLKNDFTDLIRAGGNVFSVLSKAEYARLPESLTVSPFLFSDSTFNAVQSVTTERFKIRNEVRYSINTGSWQFRITGNANFRLENLDSELGVSDANDGTNQNMPGNSDFTIPQDSLANDLRFKRLDLILSPAIEYNRGESFKITLGFPVDYRFSTIAGTHSDRLIVSPRLSISGKATNLINYDLSLSYNDSEGEIHDLYPCYIMTDYRTLARKAGVLPKTSYISASGGLEYKNPIAGLVASAYLRFSRSWRNLIFSSTIDGFKLEEHAIAQDNHSDNFLASINASKRLQSLSTTLNTSFTWSAGDSHILRQGSMMAVHSSVLQGKFSAMTKISSFLNMNYSCSFSDYSSGLSSGDRLSTLFLLRQSMDANFIISKSWNLSGEFEHYFNDSIHGKDRNAIFADLSLSYKKNRFEYFLIARNLLNRKIFSYTQTENLIEYTASRDIRPLGVMIKVVFTLK
jgi:hypothetical protein